MAEKVKFELVSPERLLVSVEADMVVVPGEEGDFGVQPGHAPFLSTLRAGVIRVYKGDSVDQRLFVEGGFADVGETGLVVLAEAAEDARDIELEDAKRQHAHAVEDLGDLKAEQRGAERRRAEHAVRIAEARIEAVTFTG